MTDAERPKDPAPPPATADLPSYSMEEEAPTGWRSWLRGSKLIILILAVALLAGLALGARPLYREAKARRALGIAEKAGEALDRGDGQAASTLLRQAALMAFEDKRVMARVTYHAARAGDMASVAELGKRLTEGTAGTAEILVFGERSLAAGRLDDAGRALDALPAELPPADAVRHAALLAGWQRAQGRAVESAATLRAALEKLPATETDGLRVMLAGLLFGGEDASGRDEARALLEQASAGSGEDAANALRLLAASHAGLSEDDRTAMAEAAERLRNHPAGSPSDEIFLARLLVESAPSRREEAVRDLVEKLKERNADTETRVIAARWLVGLEENDAVLQLVGEDEPSTHAGALMVRMDALSGLGRWDEVSALVENNRGGTLPDTFYHLFRARIAATRGQDEQAEAERRQLRKVMQFAEPPHLLFAARYAETVGWKPEAYTAWRLLAAGEDGARTEGLRGQLRNMPEDTPAAEGAQVADELLALQPQDPSARLSAAYFRLLAERDIEASAATAEEFLAADPKSPDVRRVAALGRLRTGRAAEGLEIWPEDNAGERRWVVLEAALRRAGGQADAAAELTRGIKPEDLRPEEQKMLRGE